ncbi:MAG: glycerol-3-phosphate 1-O-acyltransferase PlsY [Lachnospiraceae bacterium]|jgi:glycerol-3-phosphate acyltransferase PlsY|nr:glycerol-3-phosphate 1-O-acyltransferase PlsY [Lachnospiraceae bacterium]
MERIGCLAIGYICGLLQTGYFYGKMHGIDIRQHGSGNSGTTNALRVLGKKAGLIVFIGDVLKALIPCLLTRLFLGNRPEYEGVAYLYALYMGFGVILGHNFPFYMNFKGGKGIAAMAGLIASLDWRLILICAAVFLGSVILTHYVSLGSILVAVTFVLVNSYLSYRGDYGLSDNVMTEFRILLGIIAVMAIWRHRANIKRLLAGNENKLKL